jgi:hypothetical protein
MSEPAAWLERNGAYLAAAVAWLRVALERHAEPGGAVGADQVEAARAAMEAAEGVDPPPVLVLLGQRFGLAWSERALLLLCMATELDGRIPALCARAQGDPASAYPTFALGLSLFDGAWDLLSPERPLRYWRLVEVGQAGSALLTTSPLRADQRIVNYLKGVNHLDERLAPLLSPPSAFGAVELPPSQHRAVDLIVERLQQAAATSELPAVHLLGADAPSRQLVAEHTAAVLGLVLYRLPASRLPTDAADLETFVRLWERETLLLPVALYLDAPGAEGEGHAEPSPAMVERLMAGGGVVFLDGADGGRGSRPVLAVELARPTVAEQRAAWAAALGPEAGDAPARLAGQFNLDMPAIRQIAAAVPPGVGGDGGRAERLWDACVRRTRPRLDALAQRLRPIAGFDDLILPAAELDLLHQLAAHVRQRDRVFEDWGFRRRMNRGLGVSALFAGESGTGKTMAAEVVAGALDLDLYRIDLSAVVSKYVGETEKNLRRLFDAAEAGGAVLLFDEADALFGKRSEVKDSHDRYANIEVNYLLQRMEAFEGLAILATNMKDALDQAFLRRLRFVIDFPFPGAAQRRAIWERAWPPDTPTDGLDVDRLARLNLTGGSIHNVALQAAFLAAEAGTPVTMPLVLKAARVEFRKLDRPVNEADLHWAAATGARVA